VKRSLSFCVSFFGELLVLGDWDKIAKVEAEDAAELERV
jgi:hypothetical protein